MITSGSTSPFFSDHDALCCTVGRVVDILIDQKLFISTQVALESGDCDEKNCRSNKKTMATTKKLENTFKGVSLTLVAFEAFVHSDEETRSGQQKDKDSDNDNNETLGGSEMRRKSHNWEQKDFKQDGVSVEFRSSWFHHHRAE